MSYQVLARKWRPRTFESMIGQEHVVKALRNALDQKRLHHAYLFSGTSGVGKTTLARILAKCLNCETGISSSPCGKCPACVEIDAGRFIDLIEVDAATNTKVDEMRQLLENSAYSPSRGRFKVYVIDEVHMLSTSAFNAMLKTLEEPPEHVKFILATTDPQKIPATGLSRISVRSSTASLSLKARRRPSRQREGCASDCSRSGGRSIRRKSSSTIRSRFTDVRILRLLRTSSQASRWRCCACSPFLRGLATPANRSGTARREASPVKRQRRRGAGRPSAGRRSAAACPKS